MARNYTREQQRRYREERIKQANRVASRLMGKNKPFWNGTDPVGPDHEYFIDVLKYRFEQDLYAPKPRTSIYLTGLSV